MWIKERVNCLSVASAFPIFVILPKKMRQAPDVNEIKTLILVFLHQHSQAKPLEVKVSSQDD